MVTDEELKDRERLEREAADARDRLLQSERMIALGRLVAGVAHEINNPISFIYSGIPTLEARIAAVEAIVAAYEARLSSEDAAAIRKELRVDKVLADLAFLAESFREGATRVKDIVSTLRTLSRPQDDVERVPVDLAACLESTLKLVQPSFRQRVAFDVRIAQVPPVLADPGQLNQVFMNLIVNACQAIEGQGKVAIDLSEAEGFVRVDIRDTGPGIPPEVMPRLFEPFFTTKPAGEGTGLGLYISKLIVEKFGGRISCHNAPDQGTALMVTLPVVPAFSGPEPF